MVHQSPSLSIGLVEETTNPYPFDEESTKTAFGFLVDKLKSFFTPVSGLVIVGTFSCGAKYFP